MANRVGAAPSTNGRPVERIEKDSPADVALAMVSIASAWRVLLTSYAAGRISEAVYEAESLRLARREAVLVGMG